MGIGLSKNAHSMVIRGVAGNGTPLLYMGGLSRLISRGG